MKSKTKSPSELSCGCNCSCGSGVSRREFLKVLGAGASRCPLGTARDCIFMPARTAILPHPLHILASQWVQMCPQNSLRIHFTSRPAIW